MKIFIGNHTGLCNRFESLILAFAIRKVHGHDIHLDWPELDSLRIESTRIWQRSLLDRITHTRVRDWDCDEAQFKKFGALRNLEIRAIYGGPAGVLDAVLPGVIERIRLRRTLSRQIKSFLGGIAKPLVGVHIRRGDFKLDPQRKRRHVANSDEELSFILEKISRQYPNVAFLISYTGKKADYKVLFDRFDCVTLPVPNPYLPLVAGHASEVHPVADLFALACCGSIVVSPRSSFSHWAANCLGPVSTCIAPVREHSGGGAGLAVRRLGRSRFPAFLQESWSISKAYEGLIPEPVPANAEWILEAD